MCSKSTSEDARREGGRAVSELAPMTMVSQETDWIWAWDTLGHPFFFFVQGGAQKVGYNAGGVCTQPPGHWPKKYGAPFLSLSHTHTHSRLLSASHLLSFLSLPPSLLLQLSSQERNSLFWGVNARAAAPFDTTQEQTKSICWDLNLLIPLANCGNNHLEMAQRDSHTFSLCSARHSARFLGAPRVLN